MEQEQRQAAKRQIVELMQAVQPWQAAAAAAGIQVSRSTDYRWQQEVRTRGEAALQDGRHGIQPKCFPESCNGLSRAAKQPRRYQAASCKENYKSSWGCSSALVTLIRIPGHSI